MLRFARSFAARTAGATVALDRLQQCITPHVCSDLRLNGFAVVDGVFGDAAAAALRLEIAALRPHMHDNCTHLVASSGSRLLVAKKDIKEAELSMQTTQALAPLCTLLQHDATLCTMLSINMPELALDTQAIKLQWNSGGGGCFPMHFDTDAAVDSRLITAIWYLNPDWKPSDGGQLRLYPFPQARPVDIAPLNDRMVLFSSQRMLHRVLPSAVDRACFTIWLSQGAMARGAGRGVDQSRQQLMETERVAARQALASSEPLGKQTLLSLNAFRVGHLMPHRTLAAMLVSAPPSALLCFSGFHV